MNETLLKIITLIHIQFLIFLLVSPFTNSNYVLLLHSVVIPFIILHWICNDNTCMLTIIERGIRKQLNKNTPNENIIDDHCVTCKIIEPIYNFRNDYKQFTKIIYAITITLWLISTIKLGYKYKTGQISSIFELFSL